MNKQHILQKGIVFMELVVVMAIFAVLFGLVTINLLTVQSKTTMESAITIIVSHVKEQQEKAMVLTTEGRLTTGSYGVYFESNKYTLFYGSSYNPADPTNVSIDLDQYMQFSPISLPNSSIVFAKGSGEVVSFDSNNKTITIRNTQTTQQKTIQVNKLGAITQIN